MVSSLFKTFLFSLFIVQSLVAFSQGHGLSNFVEGELIVHLENHVSVESFCDDLSKEIGVDVSAQKRLLNSYSLWLINFPADGEQTKNALSEAWNLKGVESVQLNHTNVIRRNEPDDPHFDEQWNFYNDGTNGGSGSADIDAKSAWDITTGGLTAAGDTIVVAVIDGGFNIEHEDLEENIFTNHNEIDGNGIDDDNNGYIDDVHGWNVYSESGTHFLDNHGTHVAGTVGAKGNNGIGVTGVNWNVKILPISGSSTIESTVLQSYGYVLDMRRLYNESNGAYGAYVVSTNSSFGVDYGDPLDFPLWCAMYDSMGVEGILSAGATANININIDEEGDVPTACPSNFLISVTNTTSEDNKNGGAAYGVSTIDLGAPGTTIYSTRTSGYGNSSGTSMATPHVAGAIALMQSAMCQEVIDSYQGNAGGLAIYLRNQLLNDGVDQLSSLNGLVSSGGRLNLFKAVSSVSDSCMRVVANTTNSSCGSCNGVIDIQVLGGIPPFVYSWNTGASSSEVHDLCSGTYTVTISDASGESLVELIAISDSLSPEVGWTTEDPTCFGYSDGSIEIDTGYNYAWSGGATSYNRTGIGAGTYVVSITDDSSSCTAVEIIELNAPDKISTTYSTVIPIPYGGSNGQIEIDASGGTPPYSIIWADSTIGNSISGLSVGLHAYQVIDANGCVLIDTALLGYPASVRETLGEDIRIFPNPAKDILHLDGGRSNLDIVTIFDVQGRLIYENDESTHAMSISLSRFNDGIYILNVISGRSIIRKTIQVIR